MIELEEGRKVSPWTHETLHCVVEPVRLHLSPQSDTRRGFTHLSWRAEPGVNILGGRPGGVGEAHDGTANEEKFALRPGPAEFLIQEFEQSAQIGLGQRHDSDSVA